MIKNAVISVYDKTGVHELAQTLHRRGVNIYSTGGSFRELKKQGIPVKKIEDYIQFPEMLGGRVKSLHPKLHGGILARRNLASDIESVREHQLTLFDLVCVNLYPFENFIEKEKPELWQKTSFFEQAIEMIDIGGPAMIRSAAKNHGSVAVLTNPDQYEDFIKRFDENQGNISGTHRKELAARAFNLTASYDIAIDHFFSRVLDNGGEGARLNLSLKKSKTLRYGENPHQGAGFYVPAQSPGENWEQIHGKELSYNNLLDLDSALSLVEDFDEPCCFIFKHTNPCGGASHPDQRTALEKAIASDPVSCFGGIVLFNEEVTQASAEKLNEIFFEMVIAPRFHEETLSTLRQKKNLRLITYAPVGPKKEEYQGEPRMLTSQGGFLIQEKNGLTWSEENLRVVTKKTPTDQDIQELFFAWRIVKHVKSNAIVLSKNTQSLGIGAGQMSRLDAARFAVHKAKDQKHILKESYLASDAFFPFRDVVDIAAQEGIRAIVQPGGSIRDQESIFSADEAGIIMVFTGVRHFKH